MIRVIIKILLKRQERLHRLEQGNFFKNLKIKVFLKKIIKFLFLRTGRIIRLARLIRIVKLYKTYQQNSMKDKIIPTLFDELSPTLNISAQSNTKKQNFAFKVFNAKTQKQINPQVQSVLDNSQKLKDSPNFNFSNHDYSIDYQDNSIKDIKTKEQTEYKESRVGKKLSDLTMKRVIILVITLVFIVPLFSSSYYNETDYDYTIQLKIMTQMSDSSNINTTEILQLFQNYINYNQYRSNPIVYCQIPSIHMVFKTMEPKDLRNQEKQQLSYTLSGYSDPFVSTINIRQSAIMYSVMNILRTIFVSFILSIGSYFFSKDVNDLALRPIERMIIKVNKIASNPLASKNETLIFAKDKMQSETSIIENAITKIGVLLALGFGEAGTEIIALNIARSGDVDPMIAGKKRYSVFGFCDIRNFTDATEVLQQDVMVFVNSIAYIVHKTVDKFGGIANKNIGDAFLLVWKFPEEEIVTLEDGTLCLNKSKLVKNIADLTLISFAKIIAGINKKKAILNYRENKGLNERLPNYKVKMGFGLHIGWAIEGAIGSEFKIDASYLSPNVNLASRLEAATKQYGVSILISHELHSYFSKRTRSYCREIDRVTVKGSIKPIGLFTIDLQINNLNIIEKINEKSPSKRKIDHLSAKSNILELVYSNDFKCSLFFQLDNDLLLMTNQISEIFKNKFNEGYCKYIDGEWLKAKELLTESFTNSSEDGPTYTILKYMEGHNFYAGVDWPGYRELTEK